MRKPSGSNFFLKALFPGTGKASNSLLYPGTQKNNTERGL